MSEINSVELVKAICKGRHIPISRLERDCGFSNGYIGQLRKGTFPADRLHKIAEYLGVTPEYLLTAETKKAPSVDGELDGVLDAIQSREDMRALFKTVKNASPEEVKACMAFLTALRGGNE